MWEVSFPLRLAGCADGRSEASEADRSLSSEQPPQGASDPALHATFEPGEDHLAPTVRETRLPAAAQVLRGTQRADGEHHHAS